MSNPSSELAKSALETGARMISISNGSGSLAPAPGEKVWARTRTEAIASMLYLPFAGLGYRMTAEVPE